MSTKVSLNKTTFSKENYPKVVDTEFSQLISQSTEVVDDSIDQDEFFDAYNTLFYEIPLTGETNSHQYLIKRSTEYLGISQNTDEVDLLLEEINQLRLENLELKQIVDDLTQ